MAIGIDHRHVQANGITFHIAIAGQAGGPAVFCLHGFPEGWMSWRPVMEALSEARLYAADLRGYGESARPAGGYDVFTLTDDIRALIQALGIDRPVLVCHDWGGALGWIFAHRYSHLIRKLVVVNCPHPRTLVRAVLRFEDFQTIRIPWVPFFQVPWLPEAFMTTALGRKLLKLSFTLREGEKGTMNVALVDELVDRFRQPGHGGSLEQCAGGQVDLQRVAQARDELDGHRLAIYVAVEADQMNLDLAGVFAECRVRADVRGRWPHSTIHGRAHGIDTVRRKQLVHGGQFDVQRWESELPPPLATVANGAAHPVLAPEGGRRGREITMVDRAANTTR
jgi:pimeloyl-ACP methyl ester carboxylesterase